ncbi:MAG TPA: hypothetical protein VNX01_09720 [Bacteroidia bacterium]|nr:hypothetical protein [Bacteroidia bacterium]
MDTSTPNDKKKYFSPSKKAHKKFSPLSFAGGMLIVVFAFGLIYLLIPKQANSAITEKSTIAKDSSIFQGEHFYKIHHHSTLIKMPKTLYLCLKKKACSKKAILRINNEN